VGLGNGTSTDTETPVYTKEKVVDLRKTESGLKIHEFSVKSVSADTDKYETSGAVLSLAL